VDVLAAAATMQSVMYLRVPRQPAERPAMLNGFYHTRDGRWFFVHTGFPHLREGVIRLLGCKDSAESATAAVLEHDASELEDAFAEAGLCGAIARTASEWAVHPQGIALANLPVLEVVKIGDSPPEPLKDGDRPLSGVRVLDLTRVLAGPTASRTLAEHGADVLTISAEHLPSVPMFVIDTGHGKRSAFLDLRRDDHADRLWELLEQADVFCQSYRLGAIAGRGFSPEQVAERRPGAIYMTMNCYGRVGDWAGRRGWEQLAQTVTGLAMEEGELQRPPSSGAAARVMAQYVQRLDTGPSEPRLLPGAVTDYMTGYLMAFGAMIALRRRAVEGGSYLVSASLVQSGMCLGRLQRVLPADAIARSSILTDTELQPLVAETETAYGRVRHLAPVVRMSATPPHWTLPTVPLGTHEAKWMN
jgi:crotonobetainyl-CoA:carnitine CoA-transferase CaiB-like acyl-CoA transferase